MWLRDTGVLDKVKYDVLNPPIAIPDPTVRHKQPLILRQLGIVMIILVVGLAIGTLVFLIELSKRPKPRNAPKSAEKIEQSEQKDAHSVPLSIMDVEEDNEDNIVGIIAKDVIKEESL